MKSGISIVIPSWNGLHLLRESLPSVLTASGKYTRVTHAPVEVIVVDDGSRDETTAALPVEFPDVRLVAKSTNEGFAIACNTGFRNARFPLVALLNNDVRVDEDYLIHQAGHFEDPRVFAVTAKVFDWDGTVFLTGGRFGRFRRGFWSVYFNYDVSTRAAREWIEERRLLSAYAIGGFSTYCRDKLNQLGGFNEMLSPFHWEDVDLSYRGWKAGWQIHYEPRSVAYHRTSATIDAFFQKRRVDAVSFRNRLLFHWINMHTPRFLISHVAMILILALTRFLVLDHHFYRSLHEALGRLSEVRKLRRIEKQRARRTDAEIARLLKGFYRSAPMDVYFSHREVLARHHLLNDPIQQCK